jgi:hypothetical protein
MKKKIKNWTLKKFFDIVQTSQSPSDQTSKRMIYVHLDEFNHLYEQDPKVFRTAIDLLSLFLFGSSEGFFYFVLFTGTAYIEMRNLGVSSSPPLIELLMKPLDKDGNILILPSTLLLLYVCKFQ